MFAHTVPASLREEELSRYLTRAWPCAPAYLIRDILKKKDVRVNGVRSGKGAPVRGGDTVEIYADEARFSAPAELLFDDGRLLVCVKPQGLPCLPDADGIGADTAQTRLQRIRPEAKLCHRLDAGTGGVLLAAADEAVYEAALRDFKEKRLEKTYAAVLTAKPPKDRMTARAYLVKDAGRALVRVSDAPVKGAKEIVTRILVKKELGRGLFLAELEPVTGRTHQLRAHCAHLSCPVLGDDKYGSREINRREGFIGRLCLWCEDIRIPGESSLGRYYAGQRFHANCPDWLKK